MSGNEHILKVDLKSNLRYVVKEEGVCLAFALSADGKNLTFVATTPIEPTELFVCASDGSNKRQLTGLNEELGKAVDLVPVKQFQYQSEDVLIDGWILKPPEFQPDQTYPMILNIHGGPLAFFGNSFMFDQQLQAAAGYVVLFANPRGSAGYSQEFANCLRGDLGGKDYDDLMRTVDHVISLGYVDPSRLGVTGGSYGGYMTNRIITQTNRFAAAVTEKCISNFYSLYGTTDTTQLDCEWYYLGMPQDDPALYLERSPITQIKNINTPLLIIHGEEDLICPIEQAEQLFVSLKRINRQVEFIRFPGEGHDLNRSGKPKARIERLSRILDWFGRYLQPVDETD